MDPSILDPLRQVDRTFQDVVLCVFGLLVLLHTISLKLFIVVDVPNFMEENQSNKESAQGATLVTVLHVLHL